jgi:hypothetical protein
MATTRSSVNFSKFPKRTHQLLCRSCGGPGWYEDIADDPNDDEYGICRDCEAYDSDSDSDSDDDVCGSCYRPMSEAESLRTNEENSRIPCDNCGKMGCLECLYLTNDINDPENYDKDRNLCVDCVPIRDSDSDSD